MSRRSTRLALAATAALAIGTVAHAQEEPVIRVPPAIEIDLDRSDHLLRDDLDTASFSLDIDGWDLGFAYATEAPDFLDERQRFALSVGKQLVDDRFAATLRARTGGETTEGSAHLLWEHGAAGSRRFGVEGAFGTRDFSEYLLQDDTQGHLRVSYTTPKGMEFSIFGSKQATPDLLSGSSFLLGLPRSSLQGQRTLADVNVGEEVVEDALGASVGFRGDTKAWNAYVKKGDQHLRGTGEADPFIAYGGSAKAKGKLFSGNVEVDVRSADGPVLSYHEARVLADGGMRADRFEIGLGAYGRGISSELDQELMTAFYQTAGGAIRAAGRFGDKTWIGLWGMIEDDAAEVHRVMRGGPFVRVGEYEFGAGVRKDRQGMARFLTETSGYFASAKTPFGSGTVTVIDGETYGNLNIRLNRKAGDDDASRSAIPIDGDEGASILPDVSRYAQIPFSGSNASVEWSGGPHALRVFTRSSVLRDRELGLRVSGSESGGSYRFSSGQISADLAASLREIPSMDFREPMGHAAIVYQLERNAVGVGWLRDYPDLLQGRDATFAFLRTPLGDTLRLETALGMQDGGVFTSFMLSLPDSKPTDRDMIPRHLLPPVLRPQAAALHDDGIDLPGPEHLTMNVHNCNGCATQQEPYLREFQHAFDGLRLAPAVFSQSRAGEPATLERNVVVPGSDDFINLALELYGDHNLFLVDWDANSRPEAHIPPDILYGMVRSLLDYDDRVRLVQCGAEIKNTSNQGPQAYVNNYLKVCRQAIDDANRTRAPGREAFLLDGAPFGTNAGSKELWRRYLETDAWKYIDVATCHIYTETKEEAIRLANECKSWARGKPVAFTETNAISVADNASMLGGSSSYAKHRWWVEEVMPVLEQIGMKGVPEDRKWMAKSVFYTLVAHEEGQYNAIRFRNHFDGNSWEPTSDLHERVFVPRAQMMGAHPASLAIAPASAASAARGVEERAQPYEGAGNAQERRRARLESKFDRD